MSNITGLPSTQVSSILTTTNLATAMTKSFFEAEMHSFMRNQSVVREYQTATGIGSIVQVKIKPNHTEPTNITALTQGTELVIGDYSRANYGKIDVKLDYALPKRFVFNSADLVFTDGITTVNADVERDNLESAMKQILRGMKRTINTRLRTSSAGTNYGTSGTALNAAVFRKIRTAANNQGYQGKTIEVRLHPDFYEVAITIAEFQTARGATAVAGNTAGDNTSVSPTMFQVGGFYNMVLVSDDTYDRPTPASDPVGTAYVDTAAVVPVRGLPVVDRTRDFPMSYQGINMLYQRDDRKLNIGRSVAGSLEVLYGFKELSGDINASGVIQTTPIFQVLGGVV
jgi:hypothetical protein